MLLFAVFFAAIVLCAGSLIWTARFFLQREAQIRADWQNAEQDWRAREKRLTDELLRYAHVPPLAVEQQRVAKIPDPDVTPFLSDIDDAMRADDIKEDVEQLHPEAVGMTPDEVKALWPMEWRAAEANWNAVREPLRILN
ncbi:MAG: hypothetical protein E6Q97_19140 [Desulfurellales bacterium]|nr:MAG: hypothetical protein E6Q97_19140 [Desulfurellales bacterium]